MRSPAHRAARAPARSPPPTTAAASRWCPGRRRHCGCRPPPAVGRASRGGPAPRPPAPINPDLPSTDIRIAYARCSTLGQELGSQLDALAGHGIPRDKVFNEKISTRIRVRPKFEEALRTAREVKAHAPHCRVVFTVYAMKRLGRDAAEITALADHLTAHGLILEMLAGPLPGIYDPTGPGKLLFAFFAAMAETERENIRESTLEGLDTAARKGKHGGRPPVITDGMLHTVLRRRAGGESVKQIQPGLIIPTGKCKGHNPSVASLYRTLAEHAKREAYPEAVEQARADFTALQGDDIPRPVQTPRHSAHDHDRSQRQLLYRCSPSPGCARLARRAVRGGPRTRCWRRGTDSAASDASTVRPVPPTRFPLSPRLRPPVPAGYQACTEGHPVATEPRSPALARLDKIWTGRYHLWDPGHGVSNVPCPRISRCEGLPDEYPGEPVVPAAASDPPRHRSYGQDHPVAGFWRIRVMHMGPVGCDTAGRPW
ncbi:recombinase family protein [Streptomyces sp. NPDC096079]|uniref:recombinase family protein n=1 Tax=Streptomyces sp. NPDC096079 TaxID=3155820 RepID=UPI003330030B